MTIEEAIKWCESRYQGALMPGATEAYKMCIAALRAQQEAEKNPGEVSDGYHTFNELYHHRAVLFSVICNEHFDLAWKSKHHADGSMYDGMFIVGIETPDGPATYHYDVMPYWDMFHVKELAKAPEWDGHTPAQAIERIGSLGAEKNEPLTREQLDLYRKNNEPVWIEVLCTTEKESGWGLAGTRAAIEQNVTKAALALWYEDYGNTWIAYSRPPVKNENHEGRR